MGKGLGRAVALRSLSSGQERFLFAFASAAEWTCEGANALVSLDNGGNALLRAGDSGQKAGTAIRVSP